MTLAVMQPTYLSWIGYFDIIDNVDLFVFYNDVQFSKQSWQIKNKIRASDSALTLTVPVKKSKLETKINKVIIDNSKPWKKKHLKSIYFNYIKSKYFEEVYEFLKNNYVIDFQYLEELNIQLISEICNKIGIKTTLLRSSQLLSQEGVKEDRLINICKELSCEKYLSTAGAKQYLDNDITKNKFIRNKIELNFHTYEHPIYPQTNAPFIPYLSILDLLFNVGFQHSKEYISKGGLSKKP